MTTDSCECINAVLNDFRDHGAGSGSEQCKQSLARVYRLLAAAGITHIEAEYSGTSDEGYIDEISAVPEGAEFSGSLRDLVEIWIECALPDGWENGDGAEGTVTIDVAAQAAQFDHRDYETITRPAPFEIGAWPHEEAGSG